MTKTISKTQKQFEEELIKWMKTGGPKGYPQKMIRKKGQKLISEKYPDLQSVCGKLSNAYINKLKNRLNQVKHSYREIGLFKKMDSFLSNKIHMNTGTFKKQFKKLSGKKISTKKLKEYRDSRQIGVAKGVANKGAKTPWTIAKSK